MSHYPPQSGWHTEPPPAPAPHSSGGGCSARLLVGLLIAFGALFLLCGGVAVGFLAWIGTRGPETFIVPGNEIKSHHRAELRNLQLVEDNEQVIWFYSDALVSIDEGVYILTDRKLGLYAKGWAQPRVILSFGEIVDLDLDRETSFFIDSTVTVYTRSGDIYSFPLSSEKGRDVRFFEDLQSRTGLENTSNRE